MSDRVKGSLLALFGASCWGVSGSVGQYLFNVEGMDSRWLVPIRLGMAGILLFCYYFFKDRELLFRPWKSGEEARTLLLYGLAGVSACQFLYFTTIQYSTAGMATILQDLGPVIILVVTCLLAKRLPHFSEVSSIVLALVGVFLLTTHGSFTELAISPIALFTGVLSGFSVAVYTMVPHKLLQRYPTPLLQGWAFLMGGAAFTLLFRPWQYHYIPTPAGVVGILVVVLVGNVLAFSCFMKGNALIGPQKASLYSFAEPVTAAIIGTTILGSPFTLWDALGFACIFLMLVLLSLPAKAKG